MKKVPQDPCDRQTKPHTLYGKVIISLPRDNDEHYIQHKPDYSSIKLKKGTLQEGKIQTTKKTPQHFRDRIKATEKIYYAVRKFYFEQDLDSLSIK